MSTIIEADKFVPQNEAVENGFAKFNSVPHLLVRIPDDNSTITVLTSEGKQITFAFLAYNRGKAPQCVDVQEHHERPGQQVVSKNVNNGQPLPVQDVRVFSPGSDAYAFHRKEECAKPEFATRNPREVPTLVTVIFSDK